MVPAGHKANRLSSVNHTTKTIHHHHHHHHHMLLSKLKNSISTHQQILSFWFDYIFRVFT